MGRAFTDNPEHPTVFKIEVGPFCYFAGDARGPGGYEMVSDLAPYLGIMPSFPEWIEVAREIHGDRLAQSSRYSFSSENLSVEHLRRMLRGMQLETGIKRIDAATAARVLTGPESGADISAYESPEDFAERGAGFYLMDGQVVAGVAYSSLVCSKGVEVSIFVAPEYRRKGVATALGSKLLLYCLESNIDPHWDAANPESCALAEKLGYVQTGTYAEYYVRK